MKMDIINPNAVGIDIGSRSHFVAIGQEEGMSKNLESLPRTMKTLQNG